MAVACRFVLNCRGAFPGVGWEACRWLPGIVGGQVVKKTWGMRQFRRDGDVGAPEGGVGIQGYVGLSLAGVPGGNRDAVGSNSGYWNSLCRFFLLASVNPFRLEWSHQRETENLWRPRQTSSFRTPTGALS